MVSAVKIEKAGSVGSGLRLNVVGQAIDIFRRNGT